MNPKLDRRQFISRSLQALGGLMFAKYALVKGVGSALSSDAPLDGPGRQWFIQFREADPSGWDMWFWLHAMNPDWTNYTDGINANNKRYVANDLLSSSINGWPLAPASALFSQSSFNPLDHMMLLQGIRSSGAHGDVNESMRGSTAPYAENISRIVANFLDAQDKTLLGHTGVPNVVTTPGRLSTAPVMSPLSAQVDWSNLTTPSSAGMATTCAGIVDETVRTLGGEALLASIQRETSKLLYRNVLGAYNNSVSLSRTNYATSKNFMLLWKQYVLSLYDTFVWLNTHQTLKPWIRQSMSTGSYNPQCEGQSTAPWYFCDSLTGLGPYITDRTINPDLVSDLQFANDPLLNLMRSNNWISSVPSDIIAIAWRFAIAEFLITNNLTKVVDITVSGADSHGSVGAGLYTSAFLMGGVRQLIENLSRQTVPGAPPGTSFLDRTLVACQSDFIRQPNLSYEGGIGTGHGSSITVPLFGHGVNRTSFGAIGLGGNASLFSGAVAANAGDPLPVDSQGQPYGNGRYLEKGDILPTIANIFGAPVPLDQLTDRTAIDGVVRQFRRVA